MVMEWHGAIQTGRLSTLSKATGLELSTGKFFTNRCPAHYCNFTESVIPGEYQYFSGHVCKGDRDQNSVLCGACKPGYSIKFGSENCSRCTKRWLWLIIPSFLGLLILTCFVLLVNPNLSSGHLNACLYSYQIMKILTPDRFKYDPFIEFLAGLSNLRLDIGDGICFSSDLNNADKLIIMAGVAVVEIGILKFLTIVFPLWKKAFQNRNDRLQRSQCCPGTCRNVSLRWLNNLRESFNERVETGFAYAYCTIAVLCYVNVTHVSLQLLHFAEVGGRKVLFVDGNMEFFVNGYHIGYGCVAIVLLIIVVCIPFFLIFYRLNPQIETLRACFKPSRGCFLSYYLFCRVALLAISTFLQAGPLKSALLQLSCIVFVLLIAVARPYREEDQGGDEPNEARRAGNHAAETHRATGGGGSDGNEARGLANEGGNEAAEAQREENQAAPLNGLQDQRVAGTQTATQNRWINESDVVILTALSGIAILSSPTGGDVSQTTRFVLEVFVYILAYVPLVMAVFHYRHKLLYLSSFFAACCKRRDNQIPQAGGEATVEEPHVNEASALLSRAEEQGDPDEPPGAAGIPNYESTYYTAPQRQSVRNDRYHTAHESVIV